MSEIIHFCKIEDGKLKLHNEDVFKQALLDIGKKDGVLHLKYGRKRTPDQNAYLWGAIIEPVHMMLRINGWDFSTAEAYRFLERKFCEREYHNAETGEVIKGVKPIKELSTLEWDEIIMGQVHPWAEEFIRRKIKLPHEFYGMTQDAYDRWKSGEITRTEAEKL
jgi:hypothetical protein